MLDCIRLTAIWFTGAAVLVVLGCGGSSTPTSSTSPSTSSTLSTSTVSRADLIAKADSICRRVNAGRSHARPRRRLTPSQVVAYEREEYNEFAKLTAPASMSADWRRIVADTRELAGLLAKFVGLNGPAQQRLLRALGKVNGDMIATAKRDGFNDCAQST